MYLRLNIKHTKLLNIKSRNKEALQKVFINLRNKLFCRSILSACSIKYFYESM